MVSQSQTGLRVNRSNSSSCKGPSLSWKRAKNKPKERAKRSFWGQQELFWSKFLKFGPKRGLTWQPGCRVPTGVNYTSPVLYGLAATNNEEVLHDSANWGLYYVTKCDGR